MRSRNDLDDLSSTEPQSSPSLRSPRSWQDGGNRDHKPEPSVTDCLYLSSCVMSKGPGCQCLVTGHIDLDYLVKVFSADVLSLQVSYHFLCSWGWGKERSPKEWVLSDPGY